MNKENLHNAKLYVNFNEGRVDWDKLCHDINFLMQGKYDIKAIDLVEANTILSRKLIVYMTTQNVSDIFIGIDINGVEVKFLFCKADTFEHFSICNSLEEFVEVVYNDIKYT